MKHEIYNILNDMSEYLNITQMKRLQEVLLKRMEETEEEVESIENITYMEMFLAAKRIEGCSERTILYYKSSIENLLRCVELPLRKMTTDVLRKYLSDYQARNNCWKVNVDNVRRNLYSFFSCLEE